MQLVRDKRNPHVAPHIPYGFTKGAHIKAFPLSSAWIAYYYTHDGIMLYKCGCGDSADAAVADLWDKMHKFGD